MGQKKPNNPDQKQQQCRSSKLSGGFVKTGPPFDYPDLQNRHTDERPASNLPGNSPNGTPSGRSDMGK
jgi:hypothetical protein